MDSSAQLIDVKEEKRNHAINRDIIVGEVITDQTLASKLTDLEPFLSKKVADRLRKRKNEVAAADVDNIKQITQPTTIKAGTLRDYQIRGVRLFKWSLCTPYLSERNSMYCPCNLIQSNVLL